jgi:GNAT superfamily N-acetyltransferase
MSKYNIVKLDKTNIHLLANLYRDVYHKTCSKNYFLRKYNTTYIGHSHLGYIALHHQRAVAFVGLVPTFISIRSQRVLGAQLTDAMTIEGFRGQGLFQALMSHTLDLAKTLSIDIIFVFPNQRSYPIVIKHFDFTYFQTMHLYQIQFKGYWKKAITRALFNAPTYLGGFNNILLKYGYDGIIYDQDYLMYKYYNKNFIYQQSAYNTWWNLNNKTWLGAIEISGEDTLQNMMSHTEKQMGLSSLTYMVSPDNPVDTLFSNIKDPQLAFPILIKNITNVYEIDQLKFQLADIDIF